MSATLRYRGDKNNLIELAKNLDAFKKVPEKYTEASEIGGTLSLLSRIFIIYLIYKEFCYYQDANLIYQFQPDIDMDAQVQMHVDIIVAMPCTSLSGVDLMDETQQDVFAYGTLQREGTWWNMKPDERLQFEQMQLTNRILREHYHSIADVLFKDIIRSSEVLDIVGNKQNHIPIPEEEYDACRLHGTLGINKVAGVLQLVGGAQPVVGLFEDHWMIKFRRMPANFTHRINRLSFGQQSRHIIHPLEGDETIVPTESTTVQYFLKIVPTEIHNTFFTINTYQYSVTENVRQLDSEKNSYGSPGIYFKYDWSALKIIVRADREHFLQFIIRLCSIIAGIIVISGILNTLLISAKRNTIRLLAPQHLFKRRNEQDTSNPISVAAEAATIITTTTQSTIYGQVNSLPSNNSSLVNDLITTANTMSTIPFNTATTFLAHSKPTTAAHKNCKIDNNADAAREL